MNNENLTAFDIVRWKEELLLYKKLAKKYGLAMIMLVLNNLITPFIFVFLMSVIGGISGIDFFADGTDMEYYSMMILNELSAYVVPVFVLFHLFREERRSFAPDNSYKPAPIEAVFMFMTGMAAGALGTLVTNAVNSLIDRLFGTGEIEDVFTGMEPKNMSQFMIFAFCICVIAPVAEEIMFRDFLLKPLRAYGDTTAAIITGLIFGLYHGNFDQFAYASLLGFFYSVIAIRFNSIIPTILLHSANNIIVTVASYLPFAVENADEETKEICTALSEGSSIVAALMMAGGVIGLFYCRKKVSLNNHNPYIPEPHSLIDFASVPFVLLGTGAMLIVFFI